VELRRATAGRLRADKADARPIGWRVIRYTPAAVTPTLTIATAVVVLLAMYLIVAMLAPERFG